MRFVQIGNNCATSRLTRMETSYKVISYALFTAKTLAWQGLITFGNPLSKKLKRLSTSHSNARVDDKFPASCPWSRVTDGGEGDRFGRRPVSPVEPGRGQMPPAASGNRCEGVNGTSFCTRRDIAFRVREFPHPAGSLLSDRQSRWRPVHRFPGPSTFRCP
jgi:hypothetical protein